MSLNSASRPSIIVAVDLLPLRPGGENGGIKPAIFELLRALRHEAGQRLTYIYITNSATHAEVRLLASGEDSLVCALEDPDFPLTEIHSQNRPEWVAVPPPARLTKTLGADLLYCPFGAVPFHSDDIPSVALIADLLHKEFPGSLSETELAARDPYIQHTLKVAERIQCISQSALERIAFHYAVPRDALFYTYLAIQRRLGWPNSASQEDPPSCRKFFFYPANLWPHKNHETLLHGFAEYCERVADSPWNLVLTFHESPRGKILRDLAGRLGIAEHVDFRGFVSEQELQAIWSAAGALIFPSLHEGFGIPLLEAMLHDVPIISGQDFALAEVGGDATFTIDPLKPGSIATAMCRVSQDAPLRAKLIACGRDRLELFNLRNSAKTVWAIFEELLRGERGFPRRKRARMGQPFFSSPTPAHGRWKIQASFDAFSSGEKCFVYLGDALFATFSPSSSRLCSFFCYPEARLLTLCSAGSGMLDADVQVIARDDYGRSILLGDSSSRKVA